MGKKKTKIKFIDKKNAISFHLVAKADHTEGSSDSESEQAELDRELKAQRDEERGAKPRGRDDDEEEEEEVDTRINLLNLAAAAEGIDTRAERLKKKALKASSSQKTYLQPDRIPGKGDVQIPKDIPAQYLFLGAEGEVDPKEQAYWDASDARKAELDRQSRATALLPHNYDYSKHLKPITGRGTFMEAKRGDEMYDPEMDPRDVVVTKSKAQKAKAKAAAAPAASSSSAAASSSLSLHEEESKHGDAEEDDDDMPPLGPSGADGNGDGEEEPPVNPALLASVERLQKKLLKQRHRVRVEKDFVVALEGDQVEEFEELQDDFVMQAMAGAIGTDAGAEEDEEAEDGEDEEFEDGEEDDEEYEDEDGEDFDDEEDDDDGEERKSSGKPRSSMNDLYGRRPAPRRSAADENDDDDDGTGGHSLDSAFDKLLEDEYSDGEIGGLDDTDPAELDGHLEVEEIERELDEFLSAPSKFKSEGGNVIDKVDPQLQELTMRKLALVAAGEKSLAETEQELHDMKERPPREEQWDAESILSTYTNTENHPRMLKEGASAASSRRARSKASSAVGSSSGVGPTQIRLHASRRDVATFQAPLPIPERALRNDAASADGDEVNVDEENEEDDADADASVPSGENKGKARSVLETPEEKRARKQAVKAAQREAKERKKQLKTLYVQETAAAVSKQARLNKANPPGIKKL